MEITLSPLAVIMFVIGVIMVAMLGYAVIVGDRVFAALMLVVGVSTFDLAIYWVLSGVSPPA